MINGAFQVGVVTLNLLKGLLVAAFLSVSDFGLWGILTVTIMSLAWLKQVGVGDKFVQQSEPDQRVAFQRAFTLELCFAGAFVLLCAVLLPPLSLAYGDSRIVAPGILLAVALGLSAFQAPLWILYRRMQFTRYRALQSVDPGVSFVVTVALAAAGGGYWSLVIGALAGAAAGSVVALATSPYPLGLHLDRPTTREYVSFSVPLVVASLASLVIAQGSIFVAEAHLGLAAAGAITLAVTIANYSDRVDEIVTASLYPAICAVTDRRDLLRETFVKSNRLALIWAVPFGLGVALFATPLVHHVLGQKWEPAILLLHVFGVTAALGHIGFNWAAFYRAIGDTRPIAVWSVISMLTFLAAAVPLLITHGLGGFAAGIGAMAAVSLVVRAVYLARLFGSGTVLLHTARAVAPSVPAVSIVLVGRLVAPGDSLGRAVVELVVYGAVTAGATLLLEHRLLAEALVYLRRPRGVEPSAPATI